MKVAIIPGYETKAPTRGTEKSAGIDVYLPSFNRVFLSSFKERNNNINFFSNHITKSSHPNSFFLNPQKKVMIPLGIKVKVPENYALISFNKSGVSWETSTLRMASVIDEDFQGEIFATFINAGKLTIQFQEGQKLVQLVLIPVFYDVIEVVPIETLYISSSERGNGALGSTGKF